MADGVCLVYLYRLWPMLGGPTLPIWIFVTVAVRVLRVPDRLWSDQWICNDAALPMRTVGLLLRVPGLLVRVGLHCCLCL